MKPLSFVASAFIIAILGFVAVRTATPQTSKANVVWTPSSYDLSLFPGTATANTLNFTVSNPVANASLFLTPSLSQFVSLSPTDGGTIPAGQSLSTALKIVIPESTPLGTYEGTLHLRSDQATIVPPLQIVIQVVQPSATTIPTGASQPSPDRIASTPGGTQYVKDEIDVILKDGTPSPDQRIEQIAASTNGFIIGSIAALSTYQLQYQVSGFSQLDQLRTSIQQMPNVESAIFRGIESPAVIPNDRCAWGFGLSPCFLLPTFVGPSERWGEELVNAPAAWDIQTGDGSVVVGVIDEDIDVAHIDLTQNVQASIGTRTILSRDAGHGTHVTGTLSAAGNNGIGVTGMTWRSSLRLYDWGSAPGGIVERMVAAAKDGARVVNISAGTGESAGYTDGTLVCPPNPPDAQTPAVIQSQTISYSSVIRWANSQQKDVLWVFAAGNGCQDTEYFSPANLTGIFPDGSLSYGAIITVAAVGSGGSTSTSLGPGQALSAFSNRGNLVTVAAPGEQIYSTLPASFCIFGLCEYAYSYGFMTGTSMAAPHVAGLAALVLSQHPSFSAAQIKHCILNGSTAGPPVNGQTFHIISAPTAVVCQPPTAGFLLSSGGKSATDGQTLTVAVPTGSDANVTISTARSFAAAPATIAGGELSIDGQPAFSLLPNAVFPLTLSVGTHRIALVVIDSFGATSAVATGTVLVTESGPAYPKSYTVTVLSGPPNWPTVYPAGINVNGQIVGYGYSSSTSPEFQTFVGSVSGAAAVPLPDGWTTMIPAAINDANQIAGYVEIVSGGNATSQRAFIGNALGVSVIPQPFGWGGSGALGLNAVGQIVGFGNGFPIIGSLLGVTLIPVPAGTHNGEAHGINDSGQVVGVLVEGFGSFVPAIGTASGLTPFSVPAQCASGNATAINKSGFITGECFPAPGMTQTTQTFMGTVSSIALLPLLNGFNSMNPRGLNNLGQVIGDSNTSVSWIWDAVNGARTFNSLVPVGWSIYDVAGINDKGQVVGLGSSAQGARMVLLNPVY